MSETPEYSVLSKDKHEALKTEIQRITQYYQKQMSDETNFHVTGGLALFQALSLNKKTPIGEAWQIRDMDTLVSQIKTPEELQVKVSQIKSTCEIDLGGAFHSIYYTGQENGKPGMRDVLAKGMCRMPKNSLIPTVSTVFIDDSIKDHLAGAKPPACIAYSPKNPTQLILPDHRYLRPLMERRLPEHLNMKNSGSAQLKYGPRGYDMTEWLGDYESPTEGEIKPEQKDRLFKSIEEAQWRTSVTAKIHYKAGATWRNLRYVQAIGITVTGLYYARSVPKAFKLPIMIGSIGLGSIVAEIPSYKAQQHQQVGAKYGALEREWSLLKTQLKENRVMFAWGDAKHTNLYRHKAEIDGQLNAPDFWKKIAIGELINKRYKADP